MFPLRVVRWALLHLTAITPLTLHGYRSEPTEPVEPTSSDPSSQETEAAKAFSDGEAAFLAKDFKRAAEAFERAQELAPHPHTLFNLGLAQAHAGLSMKAWKTFTDLAQHAPTPEERAEAEKQLVELRQQLVFLTVDAPPGERVCLDGTPIAAGKNMTMSPGRYDLTARGHESTLDLQRGQSYRVDLRMVQIPAPARPTPAPDLGPWPAIAAGGSIATLGLAVVLATGTQRQPIAQGLSAGAAVTGSIAVFATIASIVTYRRGRSARPKVNAPSSPPC